ncbi:MAG: DUF2855 family protein [Actinobacteria bacterium]|nr:DUF2855 family protein [Actinomycetota bacterium]
MSTTITSFEVHRGELDNIRIVTSEVADLLDGQVLLRVDRFGFTANNITYAAFGDMLGYWKFFPTEEPWGRVPVWGFADVEQSKHPDVAEGARVYGYLPMSSHLIVQPVRVDERRFADATPHRQVLPPTYNQYTFTASDPAYDPHRERERMLFWPLFFTGFLIDDLLGGSNFWGAEAVVLASASSKTAISTAFFLVGRDGVDPIALTSARNRAFVESLGIYAQVLEYGEAKELARRPSIFVDMAGDSAVRHAVHEHLDDKLLYSCFVGGTHWDAFPVEGELKGPAPAFFFAPDQIRKRVDAQGQASLDTSVGEGWARFLTWVDTWFTIEEASGPEAVEQVYVDSLRGNADPTRGVVLALGE